MEARSGWHGIYDDLGSGMAIRAFPQSLSAVFCFMDLKGERSATRKALFNGRRQRSVVTFDSEM